MCIFFLLFSFYMKLLKFFTFIQHFYLTFVILVSRKKEERVSHYDVNPDIKKILTSPRAVDFPATVYFLRCAKAQMTATLILHEILSLKSLLSLHFKFNFMNDKYYFIIIYFPLNIIIIHKTCKTLSSPQQSALKETKKRVKKILNNNTFKFINFHFIKKYIYFNLPLNSCELKAFKMKYHKIKWIR